MRVLVALAAGLIIGVILIEAVSAGLLVLLPDTLLLVEAADGFGGPVLWPLLPLPAVVWLIGGLAAGLMSAALAPHPLWGLCTGVLLGLPAFVLVGLTTPGNPMALLAASLPIAGSAAATALVSRLAGEQAGASAKRQTV